ncbi:MAG: response regulator [Bdellovibrionales bacterium]|nr:response regulator [Bdellovibrionales bacterium]
MKILVIDDEDLVRKSLGRAFQAKGHEVLLASGGVSGIELWKKETPEVILLDVLMPDLSGPKVLEIMKGQGYIILMSAYKGEYDSMAAVQLGANEFIPKPFEDIFRTVEKIKKSYYSYLQNKGC